MNRGAGLVICWGIGRAVSFNHRERRGGAENTEGGVAKFVKFSAGGIPYLVN